MKIAIYSPYLDTFGGGEKYMMTIAEVLSQDNFVEVFLDQHLSSLGSDYLKNQLSKRFDLNLKNVNFIDAPVGRKSSAVSRMFFLKKYDLLFYLTDGSIFYPTAKKNILHIQSPLVGQPTKSVWGKFKLIGWDLIIYNSQFTKENSKNHWPLQSEILYPPVDIEKIKPLEKKKYILSVGRFFGYLRDKKHEVLIKAFRDLHKGEQLNDWSLHMAGSASEGDQPYLQELKALSKGLPVRFYPNIGYDELIKLYGQSSIYWHAAGFGENDPVKMEHFGISTVEAMSGGCVPIVTKKGGQVEIIQKGCGFLWETLSDLKKFSLQAMLDADLRLKVSRVAIKRAKRFSKDMFIEKILKLTNV